MNSEAPALWANFLRRLILLPWAGAHRALADARLAAPVGDRLGVFSSSVTEEP